MQERSYLKLVRASAIYDLIATAGFATPWTFAIVHQTLGMIAPIPDFAPIHIFMVNLLGSIVVVWSLLRLCRPQAIFGLFDSFARGLFFIWQIYYLLKFDITPVVWFFAFFELTFGLAQALGYWRLQRAAS